MVTAKGDGPENSNIDIYLRVKPVAKPSSQVVLDQAENKLEFNIPREASAGFVNNQREHYEFRFNGLLLPDAKQDEVGRRRSSGCQNAWPIT